MRSLLDAVETLGLSRAGLQTYGDWTVKVPVSALLEQEHRGKAGKLVLVTAMTPTPHGEGKTVTAIGLAMGLCRRGRSAVACLRQPSLGPVFGMKGGAAGGGKATVEPSVRVNLGLTGDIAAIESAHNLLSAMVDNHVYHGNSLGLDPSTIVWPRTLDVNDRALRQVAMEVGTSVAPHSRTGEFVITAASEVMAIHGLAESYADLKERLGRIVVGRTRDGRVLRAQDLKAEGAMATLLRDAMAPNLVLTQEGTPAFVHGGPFGNIAHGTATLTSIRLARATSEIAVVEAGFGSDLGAEKFVDLVSPLGGLNVGTGVVVATTRALRYHGGASVADAERPDLARLTLGLPNLAKHVENVRALGMDPVVALNRFPTDSPEEIRAVQGLCGELRATCAESRVFSEGGAGAVDLVDAVEASLSRGAVSRPIYDASSPALSKAERIVRTIYGGDGLDVGSTAADDLRWVVELGGDAMPVCMSKTHLSLSDNPKALGRPTGFRVRIDRVEIRSGAGFTLIHTGKVNTMPGLPTHPAAEGIDLTADGTIVGVR